eukprot:315646-Amphidinium_carterae.1
MTESDYTKHYKSKPPVSGVYNNKLLVACSTLVDDIKVAGRPSVIDKIIRQLETKVGKLTRERNSFLHTGILHQQQKTGIYLSHDRSRPELIFQCRCKHSRGGAQHQGRLIDLHRAALLVKYVQARTLGLWLPALTPPVSLESRLVLRLGIQGNRWGMFSIGAEGHSSHDHAAGYGTLWTRSAT